MTIQPMACRKRNNAQDNCCESCRCFERSNDAGPKSGSCMLLELPLLFFRPWFDWFGAEHCLALR